MVGEGFQRTLDRANKFFRKNPAIELLVGLGICAATVTPFWILAGKNPAIDNVSSKETDNVYLMLYEENSYLKRKNKELIKKVQLLNQELGTSSSRKPMMGSKN